VREVRWSRAELADEPPNAGGGNKLEAARLRLLGDVMEGRSEALKDDRPLEKRVREPALCIVDPD
jgi:hypothetical protein